MLQFYSLVAAMAAIYVINIVRLRMQLEDELRQTARFVAEKYHIELQALERERLARRQVEVRQTLTETVPLVDQIQANKAARLGVRAERMARRIQRGRR
jgi:hypothetical protein